MDIKDVLAPVDFSPPSMLAVDYGVSLARKFRARLTLLHVVESRQLEHERDEAVRKMSALLAAEDQDDLDLRILVQFGDIKDEIAATARHQSADAIVMGTHGRGLFGRLLVGSVTQHVLRKVSVPILTVCRVARPLTFRRILFATDLSENGRRVFQTVMDFARRLRSVLVIVHALDTSRLNYASDELVGYVNRQDLELARSQVAALAEEAKRHDIAVEAVFAEGVAAEVILKAADENSADLIVLAVQHKGFVERTVVGTTVERVIRESRFPVLSIPAVTRADRDAMTGVIEV